MATSLFERFSEQSPVTVMVRATLEHAYSTKAIDGIFTKAAERQCERELLFSSVVDLLAMVVWRQRKSVHDAYQRSREKFEVSVRSVYNKLNGTEPTVCRGLVRSPAAQLCAVADALSGRNPQLPGYHTRIIDGNHFTSTDHRLKVLRRTRSGPLPGQALAVLDADRMLIVDLICCEDGEAQERRLFPEVLESAQQGDLWIGDRNFCTTGFLFGLAEGGASFLIRQHQSTLDWEAADPPRRIGRCPSGRLFEQTLTLYGPDKLLSVRRITLRLDHPTVDGDTEIYLLTNLPRRAASAAKVAQLYLGRWTIENAFQEIEQALRSEINTLGYPGAALLGFTIAVITYNALSLAKWAIEAEHGERIQREQLSGYYLASMVTSDYGGMMIAVPAQQWTRRFANLTARQFAHRLRQWALHVRVDTFRKTARGPKRPRPKRSTGATIHHVSTAKLLQQQK